MNELKSIPDSLKQEAKAYVVDFINQFKRRSVVGDTRLELNSVDTTKDQLRSFDIADLSLVVNQEWANFLEHSTNHPGGEIFTSYSYPGMKIDDFKKIRIVFDILRREPGSFSQDRGKDKQFSEIKQVAPIYLKSYKDPKHPGYEVHLFSKRYDNEVSWTISAESSPEAMSWAFLFESFLEEYRYKWISAGLVDFRYNGLASGRNVDLLGGQKDPQSLFYCYQLRAYAPVVKFQRLYEKEIETFYINFKNSDKDTIEESLIS
jgi:hypothetical protein